MTRGRIPPYPLRDIQRAVEEGRYGITRHAAHGAASVYLDEEDIRACVLGLREKNFFKTMPSVRRPGLAQDVYKCRYAGIPIYLKVQMSRDAWAVVISFKQDESP